MSEKSEMGQAAGAPGRDRMSTERIAEIETAFAAIERNIHKLRELSLGDEHPAVVFRPESFGEPDR